MVSFLNLLVKENSMKKRHSEEQIIRILREAEKNDVPIREVCRQHNIPNRRLPLAEHVMTQ